MFAHAYGQQRAVVGRNAVRPRVRSGRIVAAWITTSKHGFTRTSRARQANRCHRGGTRAAVGDGAPVAALQRCRLVQSWATVQAFEPLTAELSGRWPDRVPEVLAFDEERGWLLLADAGRPIREFAIHPEPGLLRCPCTPSSTAGRPYTETSGERRHLASFASLVVTFRFLEETSAGAAARPSTGRSMRCVRPRILGRTATRVPARTAIRRVAFTLRAGR